MRKSPTKSTNDNTINIIGKLIKKWKNNESQVLIKHYKWQKTDQDSLLIECQGCDLADPITTEYNIYNANCIVSTNSIKTKTVSICSLTKKQRRKLNKNNNAQYRTNFFPELYKNFIDQINSSSNYDPISYDIERGYDRDRPQTFFTYPLEERIEINSIESLLRNNNENHFNIYTDGTCKFVNNKLQMVIGIIIDQNHDRVTILFSAKYINIPSISGLELVAIAIALSILPENSIVEIYTDSQTTINSIKKYLNISEINKQWFLKKTKCPLLLQIIEEIIFRKNLTVNFNKTPAHSTNELNNQADEATHKGFKSYKEL